MINVMQNISCRLYQSGILAHDMFNSKIKWFRIPIQEYSDIKLIWIWLLEMGVYCCGCTPGINHFFIVLFQVFDTWHSITVAQLVCFYINLILQSMDGLWCKYIILKVFSTRNIDSGLSFPFLALLLPMAVFIELLAYSFSPGRVLRAGDELLLPTYIDHMGNLSPIRGFWPTDWHSD